LSVTISPASHPSVAIVADNNPVCAGEPVQFTATASDAGINPVYSWTRNGVQEGTNDSVFIIDSPLNNDIIACEITVASVCADPATTGSNTVAMTVMDSLKISVTDQVEPICSGTPTVLTPGSSFASYLWSDGSSGPSLTVQDPGTYWVIVTDTAGCTASDSVVVEPCNTVFLSVPNAFTPDNDGTNDRFMAVCSNPGIFSAYEIDIYNRWGQRVFTASSLDDGWDGTCNGKPSPSEVYNYIITYTITEPKIESKQIAGTLMLVR
jgi:gliding motility-associated-like protein